LSLARRIVELQLAACVNIIPGVESVYRWQGAVCVEGELLLVIKTAEHLRDQVEQAINEVHPYDVPEFVALNASHLSEKYANWLNSEVLPRRSGITD
jgi:periplasmic divalent cation tolerance protein